MCKKLTYFYHTALISLDILNLPFFLFLNFYFHKITFILQIKWNALLEIEDWVGRRAGNWLIQQVRKNNPGSRHSLNLAAPPRRKNLLIEKLAHADGGLRSNTFSKSFLSINFRSDVAFVAEIWSFVALERTMQSSIWTQSFERCLWCTPSQLLRFHSILLRIASKE